MLNIKKIAGIFMVLGLLAFISGCYETDEEIFSASDARAVYNLPGDYDYDDGGALDIWAVPSSNDYRFEERTKDGKPSSGYMRAMPIKGDIYLVQAKYDDEKTYFYLFYKFNTDTKRFDTVDPESYTDVENLAKEYNVTIEPYETDYLTGKPEDIKKFLLAHERFNFVITK